MPPRRCRRAGASRSSCSELPAAAGAADALALTIEDNGPGIPERLWRRSSPPATPRAPRATEARGSWPVIHRGLGLAISRSIVEAAGGRIVAANRVPGRGALRDRAAGAEGRLLAFSLLARVAAFSFQVPSCPRNCRGTCGRHEFGLREREPSRPYELASEQRMRTAIEPGTWRD